MSANFRRLNECDRQFLLCIETKVSPTNKTVKIACRKKKSEKWLLLVNSHFIEKENELVMRVDKCDLARLFNNKIHQKQKNTPSKNGKQN